VSPVTVGLVQLLQAPGLLAEGWSGVRAEDEEHRLPAQ